MESQTHGGNAGNALQIFTVYFNPTDFPGRYVVRLFLNATSTPWVHDAATLDEIRAFIPQDRVRTERHPSDDPCIVEVWL